MTHLAVGWLEKSSIARRKVIGEGIHQWQIKVPPIRIHLWQAHAICRARHRPLIDWNGIHKNVKFDYWANWSLKRGGKNCRLHRGKNIFWVLGKLVSLLEWLWAILTQIKLKTRQSKQCGFSIYIFDNSKSKSMVRLVRSEKMALSGLVFARKIARMILIQNI